MPERVLAFLEETDQKLVALEATLVGELPTRPRWGLLGIVRNLIERCRTLQELGPDANSKAVSRLVLDVYSAEKIAGGAPACEQHPTRNATRDWQGAAVCQECFERLDEIAKRLRAPPDPDPEE